MTAPNSNDFPEPNTKSVDDFALRIYRRAYGSGPAFATVAAAVRGLKKSLGHLHAEAEDPDSVLNQPGFAAQQGRSAAFARQLTSLVEDSDLVLTQAETILKKYSDDDGNGVGPKGRRSDVELQERDGRIEVLQKEVTSQKIKIDMFLDTVQLHTPSKNQQVLENTDDGELDRIKDKVDAVASRLFRNKRSPIEGPQDDMWQEFKEELEKEGFSKDVLRQNKVSYFRQCCGTSQSLAIAYTVLRRSSVPTSGSSSLIKDPSMVLRPPSAACFPMGPPRQWRRCLRHIQSPTGTLHPTQVPGGTTDVRKLPPRSRN